MTNRHFSAAAAVAVTLALATPAYAVTEIQWWHAMTGPNNDVVVKLANDFNASQGDYKIVPTFKGSYADTLNAGIAASLIAFEAYYQREDATSSSPPRSLKGS